MSARWVSSSSIEQSRCRERTDDEQRAVEMCELFRTMIGAGVREVRLDSGKQLQID